MNYYFTSSGERVSQTVVDQRISQAYKKLYAGLGAQVCHGCGQQAQGTAHIVPKAVCKQEGITEYCWLPINMFPACHRCNAVAENFKSDSFLKLKNVLTVIEVTRAICPSRYAKMEAEGITIESLTFKPWKEN